MSGKSICDFLVTDFRHLLSERPNVAGRYRMSNPQACALWFEGNSDSVPRYAFGLSEPGSNLFKVQTGTIKNIYKAITEHFPRIQIRDDQAFIGIFTKGDYREDPAEWGMVKLRDSMIFLLNDSTANLQIAAVVAPNIRQLYRVSSAIGLNGRLE